VVRKQNILLLVLLLLFGVMSKADERGMGEWVKEADLIVVARVIGLIDPKPAAQTRKHREAHWVQVERTLKGSEETGQRIRARPNGLAWEDGKSYVMFLKWLEGDWVEAVPQQLIESTESHIGAAIAEVATQRGGVSPRRALTMRYTGGWSTEVAAEFSLAVTGQFAWKKRLPTGDYEERRGTLPARDVTRLVDQVATAGPGPVVDDAGIVSFRWLDATGTAQTRIYAAPDQLPTVTLLKTVDELVRRYGRAP
jgi:hypothetical protein